MTERPGAYLGEVVRAREIGKKGSRKYTWAMCRGCGSGSERWVEQSDYKSNEHRSCSPHGRSQISITGPSPDRRVQA